MQQRHGAGELWQGGARALRPAPSHPPCTPCLQVAAVGQYVPPELLSQAETEWRQQSAVTKISLTHR